MLIIRFSSKYRKAYKKISKSGRFPKKEIDDVIKKIQDGEKLGLEYKDHQLSGSMSDKRECHIKFNLLLIYKIVDDELIVADIGSHDMFD